MTHTLPCRVFLVGAQLACFLFTGGNATAFAANETNRTASEFDAGFIASRDTTLRGERRSRFLGPLYESRVTSDGETFRAVRPLFSRTVEPDGVHFRTELLWPLAVSKTCGNEISSRFATMYYADFDATDPESAWRLWILPLCFAGRDDHGDDYLALFPLGGDINSVLTFDKTTFFLFPLFMHSHRGNTETSDILWPFISRTTGPGLRQIRVLPFFGSSVRDGKSESMFLMWPILTWARKQRPSEPGGGFILFPFIGRIYREKAKSWLFVPPLFRWTEGTRFREVHAPWPFVQTSEGKVNKFYLWPLIGARTEEGMRDSFLFWPLVRMRHRELHDQTVNSLSVLPLVQLETSRRSVESGPESGGEIVRRDVKLWPLLSYRRVGTDKAFRILDLNPVINVTQVDNNYSPFWTLFSHDKVGDAEESELLWGLIRRRTSPSVSSTSVFPLVSWRRTRENGARTELSLLMGLIGYERQGKSAKLRILFFRFGGRRPPAVDENGGDVAAGVLDAAQGGEPTR